jgi:regulation of enolase protein 1 (concanavalin A-like superfamily)
MVFRNTSAFDGNASAHLTLQTTVKSPNGGLISAVTSGHFNAGASPDLVFEVFNPGSDASLPNTEYVFLNNGNGTFFWKQTITGQHSGHNLAVSDINGDFVADLMIMGAKGVDYALGRGDGTFRPFQNVSDPSLDGNNTAIAIRDLNRDSRHDFIATTFGLPPENDSFAAFMLNTNAAPNCPAPGSQTVRVAVCSITPTTNAITVKASGNSPNGVKRLELWVDGKKRTQAFNDQIKARVSVAAGARRVTIVAVDLYDAIGKKTMTVTVP